MQIVINLDEILNQKTGGETLLIDQPLELSDDPISDDFDLTKAHLEVDRHYLGMALKQSNGKTREAARLVRLSHQTFKNRWYRVKYM
jgi:transcriptional regulator with GAF, ATPase, and Fis domain